MNQHFNEIPKKFIELFKNDKFFTIKKLETIFEGYNYFIVKTKKSTGKTYSLIQKMLECEYNNKKFIYIRNNVETIKNVATNWRDNENVPFLIKSTTGAIVSKQTNIIVGMCTSIKNLSHLKSLNFEDYEYIFWDEFVELDNRLYYCDITALIDSFHTLIADVQRSKPTIKVFCFGNNNVVDDIFAQYFDFSLKKNYLWDNEAKVVYLNFKSYFEGQKSGLAVGVAKYNKTYEAFLANNDTLQDTSLFKEKFNHEKSLVRYMFIFQEKYYALLQEYKLSSLNNIIKLNNFNFEVIKEQDLKNYNYKKIYVFRITDALKDERAILLEREQSTNIVSFMSTLLRKKRLGVNNSIAQTTLVNIIQCFL